MNGDTDIARFLHFNRAQMPKFSRRVQRERNKSEVKDEVKEVQNLELLNIFYVIIQDKTYKITKG